MSGFLADLFRDQAPEARGHFVTNNPGNKETLLAREAIQNSWDAALELAFANKTTPRLSMKFEFLELTGDEKNSVIETLGLEELAKRADVPKWRENKFPNPSNAFRFMQENTPLKVLKVTEFGTVGMYGPWTWAPGADGKPGLPDEESSKMLLALLSVGGGGGPSNAPRGGSYGYGKAGLLSASATKTVIAYSCFKENITEESITRRLYGVSYWGGHRVNNNKFNGFGHFGDQRNGKITLPFENDEADRVAQLLGMNVRDGSSSDHWGTSFLLIEPTISPKELNTAIERSWWPAQEKHKDGFDIEIVDYDQTQIKMDPRGNQPELLPYIRAYEIIHNGKSAIRPEETAHHNWAPKKDYMGVRGGQTSMGTITLTADSESWSFPEPTPGMTPRSLVALIREPRMTTQYFDAGPGVQRQVRGVFLADVAFDSYLRRVEPPMHDDWNDNNPEKGLEGEPKQLAKAIKKFVKGQVTTFRNELRPPKPRNDDIKLEKLSELMKNMFVVGRRNPKRPAPVVTIEPAAVEDQFKASKATVSIAGGCKFSLNDDALKEKPHLLIKGALPVRIIIKCGIFEDGNSLKSESWVPLELTSTLPSSFRMDASSNEHQLVIDGPLNIPLTVSVKSEPYDQDFTGAFDYKIQSQPVGTQKGEK